MKCIWCGKEFTYHNPWPPEDQDDHTCDECQLKEWEELRTVGL
jgi:DNA-directed RNA polymerase subunit RPC12/RpoP